MFRLEFKTSNAAFDDSPELEISRILRDVARRVEDGARGACPIRDVNGGTIGTFEFLPDEEEA
jgi:hypothetical protein